MANNKILIWGPVPSEADGGATVQFYLLNMLCYKNPNIEYHLIPKNWEQTDQTKLPLCKFHKVTTRYFGEIPKEIPKIMKKEKIKTLMLFHIPFEYFPIVDEVHKIGGNIINHQTIHHKSDVLFMSDKLQDFDWWVAPTKWAEDNLVGVGLLDRGRTTRIPHGVDTTFYYPHTSMWRNQTFGTSDKKKNILFVGRVQLTKGIVPLMLAARKLCDEFDCRIIFKAGVHEGVYKSKEIAHLLTKMCRWNNRIVFIPQWTEPFYHEEMVAGSDIVITPSGHEGSSVVPVESMMCGKTVAISDIPVHRELLGGVNGVNGLLMPVSMHTEYVNDVQSVRVPDADMVYGTLKYLLENEDECEAMASEGLKRAKEHYSLDKICDKWLELFKRFDIG